MILASGHGSGSVDRQCNSSEVSSGDITGSSPPCGRYCVVDPAVPLLSCIHDVSEFQCHFGTSFWEPASALF